MPRQGPEPTAGFHALGLVRLYAKYIAGRSEWLALTNRLLGLQVAGRSRFLLEMCNGNGAASEDGAQKLGDIVRGCRLLAANAESLVGRGRNRLAIPNDE